MAVSAPADRRFRRAKVKPARKRRGGVGRALRVLRTVGVSLVVAFGCYRAAAVILGAPILQVDRIVIRGNERLSTGEVMVVLDGLRGSSILRTNLGIWRRRLQTSPWVRDAALRRILPSTVEIVISERVPVGIGRLGTQLYLIDREGTIIDEFSAQYAEFDLPIVDGLSSAPRENGPAIDLERAALAGRLLESTSANRELVKRISQIDVRDPHDAVVILNDDPALIHLGEEQFVERLQSYVGLAAALHARVPNIDYVDLRFGERVYVRPAGSSPHADLLKPGAPAAAQPKEQF